MELTTLQIIGIVVLVLLFGGIVWKIAKKLVIVAFIAIIIVLGIYFVKPNILYDWIGKENVTKIEKRVWVFTDNAKEKTKETADKVIDSLDNK